MSWHKKDWLFKAILPAAAVAGVAMGGAPLMGLLGGEAAAGAGGLGAGLGLGEGLGAASLGGAAAGAGGTAAGTAGLFGAAPGFASSLLAPEAITPMFTAGEGLLGSGASAASTSSGLLGAKKAADVYSVLSKAQSLMNLANPQRPAPAPAQRPSPQQQARGDALDYLKRIYGGLA